MVRRNVGTTYTLSYDAKNWLNSMTQGSQTTTFTYDADGQRVRRDTVTDTIAYIGSYYEKHILPQDLDGDCVITVADIMQVAYRWRCRYGDDCYDSVYDLDDDGDIDIVDIMKVSAVWGETCPVPETVKYYTLGGRRVAMRKGEELYYLFGDHLGSSAVVVRADDLDDRQEMRYFPYGGRRSGNLEEEMRTDRLFTGQRFDGTIGLYDYGARWYDPALGRFISADPIVPEPGNPQALNRYTYTYNNPLKYTDPSGYIAENEYEEAMRIIMLLQGEYGVSILVDFGWRPVPHPSPGEAGQVWIKGAWRNVGELQTVFEVVQRFELRAGSAEAVRQAIGGVTIRRISQGTTQQFLGEITIADYSFDQSGGPLKKEWGPKVAIAHELAHYWDWKTGSCWSKIFGFGAIVRGMPSAVQGEAGPTSYARRAGVVEDWAESVAGYLFPEYFTFLRVEERARRMTGEIRVVPHPLGFPQTLPGLGPFHRAYVATQFRALTVALP
jgi:RHS repeat-associated protein